MVNDTIPAGTTYVAASIYSGVPSGEAVDDDEPVDGVIDFVMAWDRGSNAPGLPGIQRRRRHVSGHSDHRRRSVTPGYIRKEQ